MHTITIIWIWFVGAIVSYILWNHVLAVVFFISFTLIYSIYFVFHKDNANQFILWILNVDPRQWSNYEVYFLWLPTWLSLMFGIWAVFMYDILSHSDRFTENVAILFPFTLCFWGICYGFVHFILPTDLETARSEEFRDMFNREIRADDILSKVPRPSEIKRLMRTRESSLDCGGAHYVSMTETPNLTPQNSHSLGIPKNLRAASFHGENKRDPTRKVAFSPKIRTVLNDPRNWLSTNSPSFLPSLHIITPSARESLESESPLQI